MSSRAALAVVLLAAAFLACGGGTKPPPSPPGPEVCDNAKDDNADGKVDCADPKCFSSPVCSVAPEDCSNGVDDNGDGLKDCTDPTCDGQQCGPGCLCTGGEGHEGACDNAVDDDSDGLTDCADPDCAGLLNCPAGSGGGAGTGGGNGTGGSGTGGSGSTGGGGTGGGGTGGSGTGGSGTGGNGTGGGQVAGSCTGTTCGTGCDCVGGTKTETHCADGLDNDGDLAIDCADLDCAAASCGAGCTCTAGKKAETLCSNNLDDDGDGATDCQDSDCAGASCGTGCTCTNLLKRETLCGDGADNDGDTKIDCADSDCVGAGTEICNDGLDNTCDKAIDCADTKCSGSAQCSNVQDGAACSASSQCAGGLCITEAGNGYPNGMCANATNCTLGTNAGCHGGICLAFSATVNACRAPCTGTGLGATGRCRPGYVCVDYDNTPSNNNNYCTPLCTSDSECQTQTVGSGCNPWSKRCESKDKGKGRYGAPCTTAANCESGVCLTGLSWPSGYCAGLCRGDSRNCATDGQCSYFASDGDNVGFCFDACTSTNQCRSNPYECRDNGDGQYCQCRVPGDPCTSSTYCCSGSCTFFSCD
jgi:hypothetical protein